MYKKLNNTCLEQNLNQEKKLNSIEIQKKKFSYNKKIELVNKINKIKKKSYLIDIFKIITSHTKDYTENNNGIFIFFHNLDDIVYEQLEVYVNNIYKSHKYSNKKILDMLSSEYSDTNTFTETVDIENKDLSNREKMILRRKKYEEYLNQNQN